MNRSCLKYDKERFWLENPESLFCNIRLIPNEKMSLTEQLNTLTRLVILLYIVSVIIGIRNGWIFLFLALLLIIIIYYIEKKKSMNIKETFIEKRTTLPYSRSTAEKVTTPQAPKVPQYRQPKPQDMTWCDDTVSLESMYDKMSINQRLAGPPNPKTLIAPIMTAPLADMSVWAANSFVTHSAINSSTPLDLEASGYAWEDCSKPTVYPETTQQISLNCMYEPIEKQTSSSLPYIKEGFRQTQCGKTDCSENTQDYINTSCGGYNPEYVKYNLPVNISAGPSSMTNAAIPYNKQIFTSTIQPNLYTQTRINEPINSNMGISFTQQAPPMRKVYDEQTGDTTYIEMLPNEYIEPIEKVEEGLSETSVYDPRFTGYGANNRSYTDPMLGQTKYYYDDIDSVRMPNYITRSKIDTLPFADTYSSLTTQNEFGNINTGNIREMANNAFLQNTMDHRNSIQESLMRKKNAESWQRRVAPIRTNGSYMSSGRSCL